MTERWLPVVGYEGIYEVSDLGRVKSLARQTTYTRILKACPIRNGYLAVSLHSGGRRLDIVVHRLVAFALLPNPDGKPQVNHINGDKTDNALSNLEWVTPGENIQHAYDFLGKKANKPRKTFCKYGHTLTLTVTKRGPENRCQECLKRRNREYRQRMKELFG